MVDSEEVGQGDIRDFQLGREVVGQCMYTRGTVDGVEDKLEDALLVVASHFVFPPEAEADNKYWDCAVIFIVITMFHIQCHNVCVCHQRGVGGCLSGGERRQGGVLLLDNGKYMVELM